MLPETAHNVVILTQSLLRQAIEKKASDIHIEPTAKTCLIRIRVDGVLNEHQCLPKSMAKPLIARLKIMAKLNIAEQRIPQDGQLTLEVQSEMPRSGIAESETQPAQSFRVSTIPIIDGEKMVLRVMDNDPKIADLAHLGLSPNEQRLYEQALQAPQGLILVTGPTGSGKTVTLYSGLKKINSRERNVSTVEDPIEMPLDQINQTQINHKIGLDFEIMLRSLLRQDPDVLMIGEIRDRETAEIAIQAAQTGHLILSTLHTNSSAQAIIRLKQMGIPSYLLASSIQLVIAQRLVRKLCAHCKTQVTTPITINGKPQLHFTAKGCAQCQNGFSGRTALYEFLPINDEIRAALYDEALNHQPLIATLERQKIASLKSAALAALQSGTTSLSELYRVLGQTLFDAKE